MTEADLGKATIAYEDTNGDTVEETVENEYVAYFQDHWMVKTGEAESGEDVVRRIPAQRVYYVERNVEKFEEEVMTLRNQVQSLASDISGEVQTLRNRIESVAGGLQSQRSGDGGRGDQAKREAEPIEIEVGEGVERTSTDIGGTGSGTTGSGTTGSGTTGGGTDDGDTSGSDVDASGSDVDASGTEEDDVNESL